MPYKSNADGFDAEDINPTHQVRKPEISDGIQRTLSRLLGFNLNTSRFKLLLADVDGRLLVSTSPTQTNIAVNSNPTVSTSSVAILNENLSRKQYIIENISTNDIYINFGATASVTTGLKIPPDGLFADDVYTGVVSAIAATGSNDVRVVEM